MAVRLRRGLVGGLVLAGGAAGFAVHQSIFTNTHINYGLTKNAVLLALTGAFGLLALHTANFRVAGSGAHKANVARRRKGGNVTEVIEPFLPDQRGEGGNTDAHAL